MSTAIKESKPAEVSLDTFEQFREVPLTLYAELGQRTISVRDLLDLRVGNVLTLTRPAGENVDVYAGDILVGSGEVLVVDSSLAVRIAEIRDKPSDPVTP